MLALVRLQAPDRSLLPGANLAGGERALQKYLPHKPVDDDLPLYRAHYWLGVIYEKQGKIAGARGQFQAALHLRPADNDAVS
jgi:Tfp pilus assembly protein PilF